MLVSLVTIVRYFLIVCAGIINEMYSTLSKCIILVLITSGLAKCDTTKYETNDINLSTLSDVASNAYFYPTEEQQSRVVGNKIFPNWKSDQGISSLPGFRNTYRTSGLLNRKIGERYASAITKKDKGGLTTDGFHADVFTDGFGGTFRTVKRRIPFLSTMGRTFKMDCPRTIDFQRYINGDITPDNVRCSEDDQSGDKQITNISDGTDDSSKTIISGELLQPSIDYRYTDTIDNGFNDENRYGPSRTYRYLFKSSSQADRDKRRPIYMEGLKRIGALHHRNFAGLYKKTPHRHVGVFNGDAFHSGLGAFETLKKKK